MLAVASLMVTVLMLTVELMKHVAPGSRGVFRLVNRAPARAEGLQDFVSYAHALSERFVSIVRPDRH